MSIPAPFSLLHPGLLPPGTPVGPWRVVDWAGQGAHGAVYRAVRIGQEHLPPVSFQRIGRPSRLWFFWQSPNADGPRPRSRTVLGELFSKSLFHSHPSSTPS